jgi:hypothetical protein
LHVMLNCRYASGEKPNLLKSIKYFKISTDWGNSKIKLVFEIIMILDDSIMISIDPNRVAPLKS